MKSTVRALLAAAAAIPLAVAAGGAATADPSGSPRSGPVTVTCGATTYDAVLNGQGNFTPARDLASTSMLIPLAFGETTFVLYDPTGAILDQGSEPGSAKGRSAHAAGSQWCSYVADFTDPDGFRFVAMGSVLGLVTPLG